MSEILFVEYPKCTTCKKARKWLEEAGVSFVDRHIVEENPTSAELLEWVSASGLPIRKFFNTSGMLYRELGVKSQLDAGMSQEDAITLLATNGMLVKRPLLIIDGKPATPGFKPAEWASLLGVQEG